MTAEFDADIPLDYDDDVSNKRRRINDDKLLSGLVNHVPTTNAGESAYIFDEEIQYGGTFLNIKMYGHVLLNQRGTLVIQNRYQVKGSSLNNFFFKGSGSPFLDYQSLCCI